MRKMVAIVLSLVMIIQCIGGYQSSITAYASDTVEYQKETMYYGDGFTVKYVIDSQWNNEYIANVVITNTGDKTIENWELSYESSDEYSNVWNASVTYHSARNYNVKNAEHNQNIKPGESVSFGFQASFTGNHIDVPQSYKILGDKSIVNNKECQIQFDIQNMWNTGCIMNVTMYNNSDENIEDWSMDFDFGFKIDNIWRAQVVSQNGTSYQLKNCEYNSIIKPKKSETFGMQISFAEGELFQYPTNVVLTQFKKDKWYLDFDKEWNREMIHADAESVVNASNKNKGSIKIGLIDSGVDYTKNINVVEEINFVKKYDEMSILFSDLSGHGTAVAGVLGSSVAADTETFKFSNSYMNEVMNEKIDGVNPYVDIYSARVLDENNETTVTRLVQGIEWAIEKKVKIINISCGVSRHSAKLYEAIKKAYNQGILIVAAAGDGNTVQYPAKYSEVMAVGSVKCNGLQAPNSPTGSEIEVVAPGEDVTTYGPLGMITSYSGTSMAAPQVTALASILWQQDPSKSHNFIRGLIDATARSLGDSSKYGYGLIDCEYALNQYENFASTYADSVALTTNLSTVEEQGDINNVANVCKIEEDVVKGYWRKKVHQSVFKIVDIVKNGAIWPDDKDSKVKGMGKHPLFHGYYKADYIKAYKRMTWIASYMYKNGELPVLEEEDTFDKKLLKEVEIATKNNGFSKYHCKTKEQKANFIYGMALHTVGDIFAHSTAAVRWKTIKASKNKRKTAKLKTLKKKWKVLDHGPKNAKGEFDDNRNFADNTSYMETRVDSAKAVCRAMVNESINHQKQGTAKVFQHVKWKIDANKGEKTKKKYLRQSYGIFNLTTYLKVSKEDLNKKQKKKLKKVVNNVANKKVKAVFKDW